MAKAAPVEDLASEDAPSESLLRRYPATIVALLSAFAFFAALVKNSLANGTTGVDFGVFYLGGDLISRGDYDGAYNNTAFADQLATDLFPALEGSSSVTHFISTPTFGWFSQPLAWLPFDASLVVWLVAGVAALAVSGKMLGLPWWTIGVLAISPPMALNTILGQTGAFVLLLFALMHMSITNDRRILAGALAGLIILKPPLAIGYGLLWLLQSRRYWKSIVASAVVGIGVSIPTFIGGFGPWRTFIETMTERTATESAWSQQASSIAEFLKGLNPQASSTITLIFWTIGGVGAALLMVGAVRKYRGDLEILSAAAVLATMLGSPHVLVYDSFILLIPVAVAYRRGILTGDRAGILAAIYTVGLAFGPVLYTIQFDSFGRGIGLDLPALIACIWLLVRWNDQAEASTPMATADSASVLANA